MFPLYLKKRKKKKCVPTLRITVLHLPLPVFKSCIIYSSSRTIWRQIIRRIYSLSIDCSYRTFQTPRVSRFIRGKRIFYDMHDRALCTFILRVKSQFFFNAVELNFQFVLVPYLFMIFFSCLFSFFLFINVVEIIGKRTRNNNKKSAKS